MPDNFHAYRSNLAPGCSDRDVEQYYEGGGDDVEDGTDNDLVEANETEMKRTKPKQTTIERTK